MADFRISLAGDLGSGKSTVAKILSDKFNAEIISVGKLQRKMAAELNMDTREYNIYTETHPEVDDILDGMLKSYETKQGNYIFDGRLAWHFVPSAFSIYLKCDIEVSAERVINANRADEKYANKEDAIKRLTERRASEKERYKDYYGVDITDMYNYRLVVDTTTKSPNEVAEVIIEEWKKFIER